VRLWGVTLRRRRHSGEPPPETTIEPTVLICDDEATLRELIRVSLDDGYRFVEASNGYEVLELARSVAPDIVLLDLMLPGVSGLEVLRELRRDAATRETPVIAMSAWTHLEPEAIAAGATDFVRKPFDPEALKARVAAVLGGT
jgi:DNA-binding response OmpR family regulator